MEKSHHQESEDFLDSETVEKKKNTESEKVSKESSNTPFLDHRIATSSDPEYWEKKKEEGMTDEEAKERWRKLRRRRH